MSVAKLQPLTIEGYKDKNFGSSVGSYKALINPETYTQNFSITYNEEQGQGTPDASIKYEKSPPSTLSFELIFDATGVVSGKRTDLTKELNDFKKIAYTYNGGIHEPNYLKLLWGNAMLYKCRLTSLKITYTLFKPDGTPLRAKATVDFKEYQTPTQALEDNSPDMTHVRVVKSGDLLPAMVDDVYGDQGYVLQVAEHNQLDNLLELDSGQKLYFPPIT